MAVIFTFAFTMDPNEIGQKIDRRTPHVGDYPTILLVLTLFGVVPSRTIWSPSRMIWFQKPLSY